MAQHFGQLIQARRAEIRLTLRDCALRVQLDPGNLSKIERGRVAPPQDAAVLERLMEGLELAGSDRARALMDMAMTESGRIPHDILSNEEVMAAMPIFLRTVNNKQLEGAQIEKLVELIRNA